MDNTGSEKTFRDRQGTIDEKGKRIWIFAKKPKGRLFNYRAIVATILLAFLFLAPFIEVNGEPLMLLNFMKREFIVFSVKFWPQDFHLFGLMMISFLVFIILFTVVFGRIWCGWACPQTIYLEMVFRRIEYLIDGDSAAQKRLKKQAWNANKVFKRILKYTLFLLVSFLLVNAFATWFIGKDNLFSMYRHGYAAHTLGFTIIIVLTLLFLFVYSWFREQICIIVCPYGRLQGVFLDRDSIIVSYDYKRGEPRGPDRKGEDRKAEGKGDCVACNSCIAVCPTGIDIRNGTQLECVNCTACIDACNAIMDRTGRERGLIRYASESSIAEGKQVKPKAKTIAYSSVLLVLIGVLVFLFASRNDVEATVTRSSGKLYQERPEGKLSNLYNIKVVNKIREDLPITVKVLSQDAEVEFAGGSLLAKKQSMSQGLFFIILPRDKVKPDKNILTLGIYSGDRLVDETKASFIGPKGDK